ncbi:MAG: ABC transporter permease [Chromatiaceae bacterium]|nr:MAG: ABC transporter permease [Chromatiaceae bacterium]
MPSIPRPTPALLISSRRYLTRHPWQTWLSIIGIALGVAVVIAVDLANASARRGFQLSVAQVTGPATHRIEAASGRIPAAVYASLRRDHRLRQAVPVIDAAIRIDDRPLTLLGLDLIAAAQVPGLAAVEVLTGGAGSAPADAAGGLLRLLREPDSLALAAADAARLGVGVGDRVDVALAGSSRSLRVVALLPETAADGAGLQGLVLTDIATAQELLGRDDAIDHIDLVLDDAGASALAAALPPGLRLQPSLQRSNALVQMTRAFQTNLTAMSLLAMLVGGFIVYNTMTFAVLQRRTLLGTLRMLGVTRGQMFLLVLVEALVLSVIGALLGCLAGIIVGAGLVQLVTQTINDIYFQLNVRQLHLAPWSLIKGVGLGLGVTLLAALGPALEAARSQPRDVIRRTLVEQRGRRLLPWLAAAGGLLILAGLALVGASGRSMTFGFAALFLVIVGASLGMPLLVQGFAQATTPLFGRLFGIEGRLAARGITAAVTRSGLAVAALAVAVAASIGVGIMIGSFRASVSDWLAHTLTSDIYVSADAPAGGRDGTLPTDLAPRLAALPGVQTLGEGRSRRVETRAGPVLLLALGGSDGPPRGFQFLGATAADLWPRWQAGELVLISEPFAYHRQLGVGEELELFTAHGWQRFGVGGVFRDYGSDSGMLVMTRPVYAERWDDPGVTSLGLVLAADADLEASVAAVEDLLAGLPTPVSMQTNRAIRELSLTVFDRTFTITKVLRLLAIGVAFVGILSALMALELERARDYAVLRATGMTRAQLGRLILLQTSALGLAAGLLAIPLGLAMGDLLIRVINLRSFGWTMPLRIEPWILASGLLLAWIAALLAGLYPAQRAAQVTPARALRDE